MRKIFPCFAVIAGLYWIWSGYEFGFWVRRGPGGGFLPIVGGALSVIFSVAFLVKEFKEPIAARIDPKFLLPLGSIFIVALASTWIGIMPGLLIYMFLWLWRYEKFSLPLSLAVSVGTMGGLYAIFILWLSVPLPSGSLYEYFTG